MFVPNQRSKKHSLVRVFNPDEPRVPKHSPGAGEWTSDGTAVSTDDANGSVNGQNDSSAGESDNGVNPSDAPNIQIAAAGGLRCDGFAGGCQSGGTYGTSGMYNIDGRVLCIDCAVKYFGLQDETPGARARFLERFLIGK